MDASVYYVGHGKNSIHAEVILGSKGGCQVLFGQFRRSGPGFPRLPSFPSFLYAPQLRDNHDNRPFFHPFGCGPEGQNIHLQVASRLMFRPRLRGLLENIAFSLDIFKEAVDRQASTPLRGSEKYRTGRSLHEQKLISNKDKDN